MIHLVRSLAFLVFLTAKTTAFQLPADSSQCILGIAPNWNSSHVQLAYYEKSAGKWTRIGETWSGRLGRDGLVWGLGLHPLPRGSIAKQEGDWRSPAGVFRIGGVWGYDRAIRRHPDLFYRQVTPRDLWIEDPTSPDYNRNVILDHPPATPWEKKQQMKQSDPAHALKLFIAHNPPPHVQAGKGSSIFFHIWRSAGAKPTAGCTTMAETRLRSIIARLDPARRPLYILLPRQEYDHFRPLWKLP